jgi:hypothetical protein
MTSAKNGNNMLRVCILVFVVMFTACRREFKIVFPDIVQADVEQYMAKHDYIMVTYISSSDCALCTLNLCNSHKGSLKRHNTGILLVFRDSDEQAITDILKSQKISLPFIIDDGKFKANNEVFKYARSNTFVMDKNRNAVFNESPIANEQVWKQFIGLINK